MNPIINSHFQALGEKYKMKGPFLEVGAAGGQNAILSGTYFKDRADRFAINLIETKQEDGISFVECNSNDMRGTFEDNYFGTVMSNAVLEHDRYFWRSLDEMKRVLAPGGLLVIGAPAFIPLNQTQATVSGLPKGSPATITYEVHARPDYWRFSRQAFNYVVCEGLDLLELRVVSTIPSLVCVGRKPLSTAESSEVDSPASA
jgi:SAM-dependent methyltransferase